MPERKCVKSYRSLHHRSGVTRFKQVENQSRQNRKSIPTYKLNTLTYAFCLWQFVIQVVMEGNIPAAELVVKHFTTAHLFTININSVFEEIIR